MPKMSEVVSRFKISKELTKHQPSNREKVLKWIQDNPKACKHTTYKKLSNIIFIPGMTQKQVFDTLGALSRFQMLYYKNHTGSNRGPKDIFINYVHSSLPKDILNNAPKEDIEEAQKLVTGVSIKQEARKLLAKQEEKENQLIASQNKEIIEKQSTPTVEIPIEPEDLKQGFSLTLNINFTIGK